MKKIISIFALLMVIVLAAGCTAPPASSNVEPSSSADTSPNVEESDSAITISHALGTTVIPSKPKRIATIAWGNHDVVLSLGIVPVGISKMNFAVNETGIFPWAAEKFEELGVEHPVVFDDVDGLDYEAIADTQPDVILAGYSGITQDEYDKLSEIAPVVAYPQGPWISDWREQTLINAEGIGMKQEAESLIAETEALIAEKLKDYPALADKSIAFCWFSADDLGSFYIYTANDPRAEYLNDLGFTVPKSVTDAITDETAFSITVSAENADQFNDVDMILTYGDDALLKAMQADARISTIPAVANGAVVLLDSDEYVAASSTPSILSIPYVLDDYLKLLDEAAQKVR